MDKILLVIGSNLSFRDLRRWINQEQDNPQRIRTRTMTFHGNTNQQTSSVGK